MKRNSAGEPAMLMHRWSSIPLSCRTCRSKKRKCDRQRPCSGCEIRNEACEYEDGAPSDTVPQSFSGVSSANLAQSNLAGDSETLLRRIAHLEAAVFKSHQPHQDEQRNTLERPVSTLNGSLEYTPFRLHAQSSARELALDVPYISRSLPPVEQARLLFQHFAKTLHPNSLVLHIPTARDLLEELYAALEGHDDTDMPNIFLLLCIFAGSSLSWTPELLQKLDATKNEAKAAFKTYSHLAMAIVDHPTMLTSSTTALVSMTVLANILLNEGLAIKSHTIRARCLLMAREMQVHYLDSEHVRKQDRFSESNEIEKELKRRAWWNLVGSDWMSAFSDVYQEGVYIFHPRHMMVNYPKHVDDISLSPVAEVQELPLTHATDLSASIYRIKLADLCRQIADTMPWTGEEDEYSKILALDEQIEGLLQNLPTHFKLDQASIRHSKEICSRRPSIAVQRMGLNFSIHTRRCRLHRAYHVKGMMDSKYEFSRTTCVAAAQKVLELRRMMDSAGPKAGFKPARFWVVMQHVLLATLVLATDVSLDPFSPGAKAREEKVLAAYRTLEGSKEECSVLVDGLQKNLQKIMTKLREANSSLEAPIGNMYYQEPSFGTNQVIQGQPLPTSTYQTRSQHAPSPQMPSEKQSGVPNYSQTSEDWDPVWSEFLALAPDFNAVQWDLLFDEIDFQF